MEIGPYGAERQQRAVEVAIRDVEDLLEKIKMIRIKISKNTKYIVRFTSTRKALLMLKGFLKLSDYKLSEEKL